MRAVGLAIAVYRPPVPQLIGCLYHDAHIAGTGDRPHTLTDDDGSLGGVDRAFGAGRIRVPVPFPVAGGLAVAQVPRDFLPRFRAFLQPVPAGVDGVEVEHTHPDPFGG